MSLLSKIKTGRIGRAQKVVIYAPEGFGKSTLASMMPAPLVLDLEGSTSQLDLNRLTRGDLPDVATIDAVLKELIQAGSYKTVVIDTVDWLEQMMAAELCAEHKQPAIVCNERGSPFSFGRGTKLLAGKMTLFLSRLDQVIGGGLHVVLLAHSQVVKFEPPDGAGPYDRYELKLSKQVAAVLKEWADLLAFGNWRTQVSERDKNESGQKFKGVGGRERMLYCNRAAAWDAKNRHGLADEEKWGKDATEAAKVFERAFKSVGAPWGEAGNAVAGATNGTKEAPEPALTEPAKEEKKPTVALCASCGKPDEACDCTKVISREDIKAALKEADDLDMTPAPDPALKAICEPHAAAITDYLLRNGKITAGQDWRYMSADFAARVLKNPAKFINVANKGGVTA